MGSDNLHPHLLKLSALLIYEPVTALLNNIIKTQEIPDESKVHKVVPVPKKGDLTLVKTYRPISLVLEKLIYNKIIDFIKPKITSHQFGFLKNILSSYSEVVDTLNSGSVVYLDLAKAFDKVSHKELLFKL